MSCHTKSCHDRIAIREEDLPITLTRSAEYYLCGNLRFNPCPSTSSLLAEKKGKEAEKKGKENAEKEKLPAKETREAVYATMKKLFHGKRKHAPTIKEVNDALKKDHAWIHSSHTLGIGTGSQAAITIAADDVYLDLNNNTLSQYNQVPGVDGIEILPGVHNVTIANGTITNFTRSGVHAFVDTTDPAKINPISQVLLRKVNILGNGSVVSGAILTATAAGIFFESSYNDPVNNGTTFLEYPAYNDITIDKCNVNFNLGSGIGILEGSNIVVTNSNGNNNLIQSDPTQFTFIFYFGGIALARCSNVKLTNSNFNENHLPADDTALIVFCKNLIFGTTNNFYAESCQFNGCSGNGVFVGSVVGSSNQGTLFTKCQFNDSHGYDRFTGNVGFHQSDATATPVAGVGQYLIDCQFNNNICDVSPNTFFGFIVLSGIDWITIKGINFEGCQSIGNRYNATVTAPPGFAWLLYGFNAGCATDTSVGALNADVASGRGFRYKNCTVNNLTGIGPVVGISAFAGDFTSYAQTTFSVSIEDCNISYLRTTSTDPSDVVAAIAGSAGNLATFADYQIKNNRISDIARITPIPNDYLNGAILLAAVIRPVLYGNSIGNCVNGVVFAPGTTNGVVRKNEVSNCSLAGYSDLNATTSSSWISNVAIANGANYVITWGVGPAPIDVGSIAGPYPAPGNKYYNLSLN